MQADMLVGDKLPVADPFPLGDLKAEAGYLLFFINTETLKITIDRLFEIYQELFAGPPAPRYNLFF